MTAESRVVDRVLLAAGLFLLVIGALWIARQIGYASRPSVEAEVLGARIVEAQSRDRPGGPSYATFRPEIRYRYATTDGRQQEATKFAGPWSKNVAEADGFIAGYPVGSRTTVRLDPDHPSKVRFDAGIRISNLWPSFLAIAVGGGLVALRRRRGLQPTSPVT